MNKGFIRTLLLFVFIFCSTFSLSFVTTKAYAAITDKDKSQALSDFTSADPVSLPDNVQLYPQIAKKYKDKFIEILQKNFDNLSPDPASTVTDLKLQTLVAYNSYLQDRISSLSSSILSSSVLGKNNEQVYAETLQTGISTALTVVANQKQQDLNLISTDQKNLLNASAYASQNKALLTKPPEDATKCSLFSPTNIGPCISDGVSWIINNTLLQIAGFLVWVTANMFNYSIQIGILQFASWAPDSLYPIWLIIRQILSLLIVFIGLYLGFMYILGKEDKFARYIPWVMMFALFVNFSYPLARTAIDISNIVSLKIYASVVGNDALGAGILSQNSAGALIMNRLGLQGLVLSAEAGTGGSSALSSMNSISGSLLAVVYVLFAAYIFLIATGIMVMRTAALIFLTIASPLLLVDSVLPMLGDKAKQTRKIFFEQLAVGPVFMIMLALTLKFLEVFSTGPLSQVNGTGGSGDATIKNFFNIAMMLVMLFIMLKVTKATSGTLGEYATNAMGKVGGFGLGVATGGTGFLARQGIGGLAAKARDSKWVINNQDSFIGRRAYNLSNSVASSTFDLRNTAVAGKMAGLGMGMGMGAKLGYDEETKARIEKKKKDALEARNRIKTHFERDQYKENIFGKKVLDANGQAILLNKKGEVNEAALEAQRRFDTNSGGALFLTKKQKEAVDDALIENMTAGNEKIKGEIEKESSIDMGKYNSLKSKTEKENFVNALQTQLADLKKTDTSGTGKQSKAVMKTLEDIGKKETAEKEAFDKEVKDVLYRYNQKEGKDQKDYFTNQTKEIQDAILTIQKKTNEEGLKLDKERDEIIKSVAESGVDIDLTPTSRESSLAAANNLRGSVEAVLSDKPKNGAVDMSQPFNVEQQVATMSFAQRAAAKREAAQIAATQVVQKEMTKSGNTKPLENPATVSNPKPSPPPSPSTTSASIPETV